MESLDIPTVEKFASEVIDYCFDFSKCREVVKGRAISNPVRDDVAGLTLGTPAINTADEEDEFGNVAVPANKGVNLRISGGTAGVTYTVDVRVSIDGGGGRTKRVYVKVK